MIIINKKCVNPDLARNNNNICYLYIYLISDTIITHIYHKVTQAEVYTSLSLVAFHIVPCCRLCRFQQIVVWLKCIARLIHVDFAWKKNVYSFAAKLLSSIGVNLAAHGEDVFAISIAVGDHRWFHEMR